MKPVLPNGANQVAEKILEVQDLRTYFFLASGVAKAVDGVSFHVERGKAIGIVGESGSGKSITASSIIRLLPPAARIEGGTILFKGRDITKLSPEELFALRGKEIATIFQDPMTSLDPVFTIGCQIRELLEAHASISRSESRAKAVEALSIVGIPDAERRLNAYPHEFSGGMRQRVMIAMALICNPSLIIADEPTTALDVTVQAQVLSLLQDLQKRIHTAILLITHNLGLVWKVCDQVMVMYAGKTVEYASTQQLYENPCHPYSWGLFMSIPKLSAPPDQKLAIIPGIPPDLRLTGRGCNFAARCPYADGRCRETTPPLREFEPGHWVACHLEGGIQKGEARRRFAAVPKTGEGSP
jgi:oligopeptide/dipeptide ABC transporter ATP-binding protein